MGATNCCIARFIGAHVVIIAFDGDVEWNV